VARSHFRPEEFRCRCRCGCGLGMERMDPALMESLYRLRDQVGPIRITSAVRCPAHNAAVGGSPTSSHLAGHALDIAVVSVSERYLLLRALLAQGWERIGIGRDFLHVDNHPAKPSGVVWLY